MEDQVLMIITLLDAKKAEESRPACQEYLETYALSLL